MLAAFATGVQFGDFGGSVKAMEFTAKGFADQEERAMVERVIDGDVDAVLPMVGSLVRGANAVASDNVTPLLLAVQSNDEDMVRALLQANADPNGAESRAPLALAVYLDELNIVILLLDAGADPDGTIEGESALYRAALIGADATIDLLLDRGASISGANTTGIPAAIAAASSGKWMTVERLLEKGASPFSTTRGGSTIGNYLAIQRLGAGGAQGPARQRVQDRLSASGFPFPSPPPVEVRAMRERNEWPPVDR